MNLGIVILTKGNLDYLFRCLSSIKKYTRKVEYTIYIADTGSTESEKDKTVDFIKNEFSEHKNCKFYKLNYYNFAKCNNFIIDEVVKEDNLLLCNNDIELLGNSIDVLVRRLIDGKKIGTVGCRLIYPQDGTIQHAGQYCRIGRWGGGVDKGQAHLSLGHRGQYTKNTYADWEPVMGNTGGYMFVKRDTYLQAGKLNEKYTHCFEDVEFNWVMLKMGLTNYYCDTAVCKHYESLTRKQNMDIQGDHGNLLTPYFNSLPMDIKNKIVKLPDR